MTNQFDSKGGEQNVGQGDHAIGKQVNVTQHVSGDSNIISGTGNVTVNNGVSEELFAKYAKELGATEQLINSFFGTLLEHNVPREQWDRELREIACQHKALLASMGTDQAAKQAIKRGDYAKAEELLEDVARRHTLAAAEANAAQARLHDLQWHYEKAAAYWQKAAALLPEESKQERAEYLHEAGYDLHRIAKYTEALRLYEQSLAIRREIGFKAGEGVTLNNISQIYKDQGDYATALSYLKQNLVLFHEIGDREHEGRTLANIGRLYYALDDYDTALNYFEQSLAISWKIDNRKGEEESLSGIAMIHYAKGDYDNALPLLHQSLAMQQEFGDKENKGITLSSIGLIYDALGDYATALKYLEQSLAIMREIGDRRGEAVTSWNIGRAYEGQGELAKAEQHMSRTVQIDEEIGRPELDRERKHLESVRAKLRGQ